MAAMHVRLMIAAIAVALPAGGCSAAGSHWNGPFSPPHPSRPASFGRGPAVTHRIYDILVPDFHNYSRGTVRILSVRLVSPHKDIRVLGARAYPYSRTRGTGSIDEGDLARTCRQYFVQQPITSITIRPGTVSRWYVALALEFLAPGKKYHFGVARIGYLAAGKQGWQYYRLPNIYISTVTQRAHPRLYAPRDCSHGAGL